jgi:hypothetical protein
MTAQGREGMVVKPLDFMAEDRRGVTHPAIKCRGAEYLRIIYGPEYLLPANLERLSARNVRAKRSLASREFALGVKALERFVRKEPCASPTSASLAFSPWRANRPTPGSDTAHPAIRGHCFFTLFPLKRSRTHLEAPSPAHPPSA